MGPRDASSTHVTWKGAGSGALGQAKGLGNDDLTTGHRPPPPVTGTGSVHRCLPQHQLQLQLQLLLSLYCCLFQPTIRKDWLPCSHSRIITTTRQTHLPLRIHHPKMVSPPNIHSTINRFHHLHLQPHSPHSPHLRRRTRSHLPVFAHTFTLHQTH